MTREPQTDRRAQRRVQLARPCKIRDTRSRKFHAGVTVDLSASSLLLTVQRRLDLRPGDRVLVGVAMSERQGLLQAKEMMEAEVVRTLCTPQGHTALAVRFAQDATIPAPEWLERAA